MSSDGKTNFESFMDEFTSHLSIVSGVSREFLVIKNRADLRLLREAREDGLIDAKVDEIALEEDVDNVG